MQLTEFTMNVPIVSPMLVLAIQYSPKQLMHFANKWYIEIWLWVVSILVSALCTRSIRIKLRWTNNCWTTLNIKDIVIEDE